MNRNEFLRLIEDKGGRDFVGSSAGIEKYARLFEYFDKANLNPKSIADLGGGYFSYKVLSLLAPNSHILTINKNRKDMKGCPNQLAADLEKDIRPKGRFDLVFSADTIEHMLYPDKFMSNVCRLLDNGGLLIITTPNLASWMNRLSLCLGWSPTNYDISEKYKLGNPFTEKVPAGHRSVFTSGALREYLRHWGFDIIYSSGYAYTEKVKKWRTLRIVAHRLVPRSMQEGIFVAARKNGSS